MLRGRLVRRGGDDRRSPELRSSACTAGAGSARGGELGSDAPLSSSASRTDARLHRIAAGDRRRRLGQTARPGARDVGESGGPPCDERVDLNRPTNRRGVRPAAAHLPRSACRLRPPAVCFASAARRGARRGGAAGTDPLRLVLRLDLEQRLRRRRAHRHLRPLLEDEPPGSIQSEREGREVGGCAGRATTPRRRAGAWRRTGERGQHVQCFDIAICAAGAICATAVAACVQATILAHHRSSSSREVKTAGPGRFPRRKSIVQEAPTCRRRSRDLRHYATTMDECSCTDPRPHFCALASVAHASLPGRRAPRLLQPRPPTRPCRPSSTATGRSSGCRRGARPTAAPRICCRRACSVSTRRRPRPPLAAPALRRRRPRRPPRRRSPPNSPPPPPTTGVRARQLTPPSPASTSRRRRRRRPS